MPIELPIPFIEKINRSFGDTGKVWLLDLPETVNACVQQWSLTDLRLCNQLSYNLILFAKHPEHGPVVLKIGVPHLDLFSEMEAIQLYDGRGICACYAVDVEHGAMLLERVLPGEDLRMVDDADQRYRITAELYRKIKTPVPDGCSLPTYQQLIQRAIDRIPEHPLMPSQFIGWLYEIQRLHQQMLEETDTLTVLHCDLHHMNILRSADGWKLIDPKGFIGVPAMECIRFMQNELDLYRTEAPLALLNRMIAIFAPALQVSEEEVRRCLFIDSVLSCYWSHEDHAPELQLAECTGTIELALQLLG